MVWYGMVRYGTVWYRMVFKHLYSASTAVGQQRRYGTKTIKRSVSASVKKSPLGRRVSDRGRWPTEGK